MAAPRPAARSWRYTGLLDVRKESPIPCFRQICDQVARLVDDGSLPVGSHLPPTRVLARTLGLNRSTVVRAYQELWALGYLESRSGSYSTVRERLRPRAAAPAGAGGHPWAATLPQHVRRAVADLRQPPARRRLSAGSGGCGSGNDRAQVPSIP